MKIRNAHARQILDSRGTPTIAVSINGCTGMAPSGASTGTLEALELRDGGKPFGGKGVLKAVTLFEHKVKRKIKNKKFESVRAFDSFLIKLDGTPNKTALGGNTLTAASIAFTKALAVEEEKEPFELISHEFKTKTRIPMPCSNLINGGAHASNGLAIQEHMLIPRLKSFAEATRCCSEVFKEVKKNLVADFGKTAGNSGDEGGLAPPISDSLVALKEISRSAKETGWLKRVSLGIDAAASSFYDAGLNAYRINNQVHSPANLASYYRRLASAVPLTYLEDPFFERDSRSFTEFTAGFRGYVVADDLTVTNAALVEKAVEEKAANGLIVKINQVGTVSEAVDAALTARKAGWILVASHRSGETEDSFLSDFAFGLGCDYIKLGAPNRSERTVKFNRLMEIEELK